jgi:hypothetical protein
MMDKIQPSVTQAMIEKLLAPFSPEDVKKAVFNIGDFKAPGRIDLMWFFIKSFGTSVARKSPKRCCRL